MPTTIKDVAARAGFHFSTVSLALRNDPRIPDPTRLHIQRVAQEMGYEVNAMMRALCAYREAHRPHPVRSGLAYLTDMPADNWFSRLLYSNARDRAEKLGYNLMPFNLGANGLTLRRAMAIWWNTGLKGVAIGPFITPGTHLGLDWSKWVAVQYGFSVTRPAFNKVTHDPLRNMQIHIEALRARDYRRIGVVLPDAISCRTLGLLDAAILLDQKRHPRDAVPPAREEFQSLPTFRNWIRKHRIDVVVGDLHHHAMLLELGLRVPEDIGFSLFSLSRIGPDRPTDFAGMEMGHANAAAALIQFLVAQIHEQALGTGRFPLQILVPGEFRDGTTLRTLKAAQPSDSAMPAKLFE